MKMKYFCALLLAMLLGGCALSNQGEIDAYYTPFTSPPEKLSNSGEASTSETQKFSPIFVAKEDCPDPGKSAGGNKACSERFIKGDLVSFHLVNAHIGEFDETLLRPAELGQFLATAAGKGRNARIKGEIALVSRVFPFTGRGDGDFQFGPDADGRVVFYSDDVTRYQNLNLRNIPIYGPVEPPNGPLAFRFEGVELDTNSEQEKALLRSLSALGSAAYAPASPALGVLNTLGSDFIDSQPKTTKFFRMTMVFDQSTGGNENHLQLRPGYYIFIKDPYRLGNTYWQDALTFNPVDGNLYVNHDKRDTSPVKGNKCTRIKSSEGKPCELRFVTYFVIEVGRNVGTGEVQIQQEGFRALIDTLSQTDSDNADRLNAANSFERRVAAERLMADVRNKILTASGKTDVTDLDERRIAGLEAMMVLKEQALKICNPMGDSEKAGGDAAPVLSRAQLDYLFRLTREASKPEDTVRAMIVPFGDNGYCSPLSDGKERDTLAVNQLDTLASVNTVFDISPPTQ